MKNLIGLFKELPGRPSFQFPKNFLERVLVEVANL